MWYTVIDLFLVSFLRNCLRTIRGRERGTHRVRIAARNTFGDNKRVALGVTGELAFFALHAGAVFEELPAVSAENDAEEMLGDEFVAILLVYLFFSLAHGALASKTAFVGSLACIRLD